MKQTKIGSFRDQYAFLSNFYACHIIIWVWSFPVWNLPSRQPSVRIQPTVMRSST